jgi:hypothetical protein
MSYTLEDARRDSARASIEREMSDEELEDYRQQDREEAAEQRSKRLHHRSNEELHPFECGPYCRRCIEERDDGEPAELDFDT